MDSSRPRLGLPKNRSLHVIDLENQFGGTAFTAAATSRLAAIYPRLDRERDHVVIGASCQRTAYEGGVGWVNSRLVWAPGHDGADIALADVLLNEHVDRRFGRVVIGSGDGMFAPIVGYLASRGLEVGVVARKRHLSRTLRMAAHWVEYLPDESFLAAAATVVATRTVNLRRMA